MIVSLEVLAIASIATVGLGTLLLMKKHRFSSVVSLFLTISLLFFTANAPAFAQVQIAAQAASDEAVTQDETDFNLTPSGSHYSGLEYATKSYNQEDVSDDVIEKSIKSKADDRVVVAVANGSVRLEGRVDSKEDAEALIAKIKEMRGVHEITYNLGLDQR